MIRERERDLVGAWITVEVNSFDLWLKTGDGRINVEYQVLVHDACSYTVHMGHGQLRAFHIDQVKSIKADGYQPKGFVPSNNVELWLAERNKVIRIAKAVWDAEEFVAPAEGFGPWNAFRKLLLTTWEQTHPRPEKFVLAEALSDRGRPARYFFPIDPEKADFPSTVREAAVDVRRMGGVT